MTVRPKTIVFWKNILSIHQAAFVRELSEIEGLQVIVAYEEEIPASRLSMGWTVPNYGKAKIVSALDQQSFHELLDLNTGDCCHMFGGYYTLTAAYHAFQILRRSKAIKILISEAFDFRGLKGWLRAQRSRWHTLTEGRNSFSYVFAMGELGVNFFLSSGFTNRQVREFGYLVDPSPAELNSSLNATANTAAQLIYVGQLIDRKGVDLLLNALAELPRHERPSLLVVGDGPRKGALSSLLNRYE